ncbi:MAG: fluoride efflux transporter CrcB [Candidatus Latescibacterota bacterium]|nr:fluoride efflux transporter CrcB [Candidatus Latescibacterota bacterium]
MLEIFVVGGGGFIGSILRYLVTKTVQNNFPATQFPYSVMLANLLGCFLIGLLSGLSLERIPLTPNLRLFFFVGILGGFTTFSSFSLDAYNMLNTNDLSILIFALLHILAHVILGITAVYLGLLIGKNF